MFRHRNSEQRFSGLRQHRSLICSQPLIFPCVKNSVGVSGTEVVENLAQRMAAYISFCTARAVSSFAHHISRGNNHDVMEKRVSMKS